VSKIISIILCAVIILCFSGCVVAGFMGAGAVFGKGDPEKYEIRVGGYNKIKVEGRCDIQYYATSSDTVILEVQPNLREYFVVEVIDNELIIRTTKRINFYSKKTLSPVLTVSAPALNSLKIAGMCAFKANDKIKADSFNLELSGAGDGKIELDVNSLKASMSGAGSFEISGKADNAEMVMSGAGEFDAFSFHTREASVNLSGVGTIRINCSEKLYIKASGAGTVEYKGSPSLSLDTSGIVNIKKAD
jgi:hypothetical protein